MARALLPLCLGLLALAPQAGAQRLEGLIRGPSGAPVAGVVLTARDEAGASVGQTITRDDGRYLLFLERPSPVRIEAKRVGFTREVLGERTVEATGITGFDAQLASRRVDLPAQLPRGAATCDRNARGKRVADALYDEIVTAATAARFRIGRTDVQGRWVISQFRIAKRSDDTLRAALRRASGALPQLFPPVTTERLEDVGFFATVGGDRSFYAPDLDVITTRWFLETHCIRLRRIEEDSLVLAFEPLRQRKGLVDVAGEFTLAWPSLELLHMNFRYVDLPETERESGAGGRLQFARTPAGGWIVTDWSQRTPFLNYYAGEGNTTLIRTQMTRVDVVAHFLSGGRVLAVADSGGTRYQRDPHGARVAGTAFAPLCPERTTIQPTAAVRGRFLNDSTDLPLAGTVIRASWATPVIVNRTELQDREEVRETTTDQNGSWALCDIPLERDVMIRWEAGDAERRVPLRVAQPFSVTEVRQPR
jgi:hypothetical protein